MIGIKLDRFATKLLKIHCASTPTVDTSNKVDDEVPLDLIESVSAPVDTDAISASAEAQESSMDTIAKLRVELSAMSVRLSALELVQ